jgi:GNAT superfamily N-acetyltransferase
MNPPRRVMMVRPHLDHLPSHPLPEPYRIRWYAEGDDDRWMAIKAASDVYHAAPADFFTHTYGGHRDLLGERQAFLCDGAGEAVGTVTAWFEELDGARCGKVNWLLLSPRAQGLGLSKPLLSACCARLAELGHTSAMLYTLIVRMPAINLYRGFGFVPLIHEPSDVDAWDGVSPGMKVPFTRAEYLSSTPGASGSGSPTLSPFPARS